jgi:hypothetical protein
VKSLSKNNIFSGEFKGEPEKITAQIVADSFQEAIDRNGVEDIKRAIVIVKRQDGSYEMGYTYDELESHIGLLDIGKDILKDTFGLEGEDE